MKVSETVVLKKLSQEYGLEFADDPFNPLNDSMSKDLIDGALRALETVAISSMDYKLTVIVKLLQSWKNEKQGQGTTQLPASYNPFLDVMTSY